MAHLSIFFGPQEKLSSFEVFSCPLEVAGDTKIVLLGGVRANHLCILLHLIMGLCVKMQLYIMGRVHMGGNEPQYYQLNTTSSFPGLPHLQPLITYSFACCLN